MPFGPTPSIGLVGFAIIKIAGYSLFGHELNKSFKRDKPAPFVFGLTRTALGIVVGALAIFMFTKTPKAALTIFLLFLVPFRLGEWTSIIWFFYRPAKAQKRTTIKMTTLGILWSFALDIPVIASLLIIPGGLWIC